MELLVTLDCDGTTLSIPIEPDGEPQDVVHVYFQPITVRLLPDCEETNYNEHGDCHRSSVKRVATTNVYGKRRGESVWLCGHHGRLAALRGEVKPL